MNADTVVTILDWLEAISVDAWVDGGWGVDAPLGRETRPHHDLDLVVSLDQAENIKNAFASRGCTVAENELPIRFVLAHPELGRIDFLAVTFDQDGGGIQPQPGGKTFRYPPEGFVTGLIAGRAVRCISPEVQMLCHLGYEPSGKDVHDVLGLHRECGVELPDVYRSFSDDRAV